MAKYRDDRGRFISSSDVETRRSSGLGGIFQALFGSLVREEPIEQYQEPEKDLGYQITSSWEETYGKNTVIWTTGDPSVVMDSEALRNAIPPEGAVSFQARYGTFDNPSYPRGWISYDSLMMSEWPPSPDWLKRKGGIGIGAIVFYVPS